MAQITPGCTAYFRIPPIWMVDIPSATELATAPGSTFTREVYHRKLTHGIEARVRRDGVIIFDCRSWEDAGETEIPAYNSAQGQEVPKAIINAENTAEVRAQVRAQLINVHQLCLGSSAAEISHRSFQLGEMVIPSQAFQLWTANQNISGNDCRDHVRRFALDMLDYQSTKLRRSSEFHHRLHFSLKEVEYSFDLLDKILLDPNSDLLTLTDLLFRAANQWSQNRFEESLILSWSVCERLININWNHYLETQKNSSSGPDRMNKERKKKLQGRDYTASVMMEILELTGTLPFPLFDELNKIRKARNDWMHGLRPVDDMQASSSIREAAKLLQHTTGIKLLIPLGRIDGSGGSAPKEYVKMWQKGEKEAESKGTNPKS